MIAEAEALLRARAVSGAGRYQLEAARAVGPLRAQARGAGRDWAAIVTLYEALHALTGSPVAALNRAVALAQAEGTDAGLAALEALAGDERLAQYQPYWAARAELLSRSGAVGARTGGLPAGDRPGARPRGAASSAAPRGAAAIVSWLRTCRIEWCGKRACAGARGTAALKSGQAGGGAGARIGAT